MLTVDTLITACGEVNTNLCSNLQTNLSPGWITSLRVLLIQQYTEILTGVLLINEGAEGNKKIRSLALI